MLVLLAGHDDVIKVEQNKIVAGSNLQLGHLGSLQASKFRPRRHLAAAEAIK